MSADLSDQLIEAATEGDFAEVKRLVGAGADVNYGPVPAYLKAYFRGHIEIAKYLYDEGGDVNYDGFGEVTPLMGAAIRDDVDFMAYLIERGAKVDLPLPAGGETALHKAAVQNRVGAAHLLIERGADVNRRTKEGGKTEMPVFKILREETPLHIAAVRSNEELIGVLLEAGAEKGAKTTEGKTAHDYAVEHDRPKEVIDLLNY
jgi:ankyrin repeat protein